MGELTGGCTGMKCACNFPARTASCCIDEPLRNGELLAKIHSRVLPDRRFTNHSIRSVRGPSAL